MKQLLWRVGHGDQRVAAASTAARAENHAMVTGRREASKWRVPDSKLKIRRLAAFFLMRMLDYPYVIGRAITKRVPLSIIIASSVSAF